MTEVEEEVREYLVRNGSGLQPGTAVFEEAVQAVLKSLKENP